VEYTYDAQGRMQTMKTWQDFADNEATATTTWNYNSYRGWLTNKTYDGGAAGPIYSNTPAGRLATRKWARNITTTYGYNNAGALARIVYSDGTTPNLTNTFDRLGRAATTVCNGMTTTFAYNDANELLSESYSGGILNGLAVTNAYDAYLRRTALGLNTQPSTLTQFDYDSASRLSGVTNGNYNVAYAYLANTPLVSQITFRSNTVTRMTTTKSYDFLNRLTGIGSVPSGAGVPPVSFTYNYDFANQRTRATLSDGSYWLYEYDSLGQVRSGKKYWYDGTPVAGQQFEYAFDDIGNRTQAKAGGDENGWNLRSANYAANNLNQYTNRDVPGYVDILGLSFATNSVTVNDQTAYRKGEYFRKELPVNNGSASLWTNIIVAATGQTSVTGNLFVAKSPELFGYDADGNMTNDGRWALTWDAENRLTKTESLASGPLASKRKVVWEFDCRGRRIRQTTSDGSSGSYVVTEDLKFLSDGWRHIAELNATNNALVRSYVWGLDLSGSLDGAGGVGGLLMLNSVANGAHFYAYDGNGNVAVLVKATDGTASANYEYEPFGQVLRTTGPMANENHFQSSTKRSERATDFKLYEYRLFRADLCWLSRDPLEEADTVNVYATLANDGLNQVDFLGMASLVFKVVVGTTYPRAMSGRWSQPYWAGDGRYGIGNDWADAEVTLDNTQDVVPGTPVLWTGNYCNTVAWSDPLVPTPPGEPKTDVGDAGSILIALCEPKNGTGGGFRVQGTYTAIVSGSGLGRGTTPPKPGGAVYALAALYRGYKTGLQSQLMATTKHPSAGRSRKFSIYVTLKPGETKVVLMHYAELNFPNRAGGKASFGAVHGWFKDVTVEKVR